MSSATKRAILRSIHLIFAIPIIGYVYSPFAELPNYAPIVRFVSIPVLILSSFWMYAGVFFAIIGEKEVDMFVNALDDVLAECRKFPRPDGGARQQFRPRRPRLAQIRRAKAGLGVSSRLILPLALRLMHEQTKSRV